MTLASVEATSNGFHFANGGRFDDVPEAVQGHCQLTVDADTVMVFGGTLGDGAYSLDVPSGKWGPLPKMTRSRNGVSCGLADNGTVVVVAGGIMPGGGLTNTVELLDLTLSPLSWTTGTDSNVTYHICRVSLHRYLLKRRHFSYQEFPSRRPSPRGPASSTATAWPSWAARTPMATTSTRCTSGSPTDSGVWARSD